MNRMTRLAVLAVVVGVMALGPTVAMAAPAQGGSVALERAAGFSILSVFAKLLGIQQPSAPGSVERGQAQPVQAPSTVSTGGSGNVSTDSAVWTRCLLLGTC